jgi:hypothetical protein
LPSGEQGNNALFFPISGGLAGAFFPITGILEMPKPSGLSAIPQELMAKMAAMTPEQREMVMLHLKRQREVAMMSQVAATVPPESIGHTGTGLNAFASTSSPAQHQQPSQQQSSGLSVFGGSGNSLNTYGVGLSILNTMGAGLGQAQNLGATLPRPLNMGTGGRPGGPGSMQAGIGNPTMGRHGQV